jgi:inner membrane transporter RhtA
MIAGASLSIQLAAAIAHDLFDGLGPVGASALRFALGVPIFLAVARPPIRGRDIGTWAVIAAYGASLAALNLTFFQAISLIPMGIAVTLSFAGPAPDGAGRIAPSPRRLLGAARRRRSRGTWRN